MSNESTHFTYSGIPDHVMFAPMSVASDGPILLTQLRAMTMLLIMSTPERSMMAAVTRIISMKSVKKANNDTILACGTL